MDRRLSVCAAALLLCIAPFSGSLAQAPAADPVNPPPTAADWANIAKLPDWSGVWTPDIADQDAQVRTNPTPWNAKAAEQVAIMNAEERAGNPRGLFIDCLPESMPAWMLISHNAMEILFTPGRVTMLGESDSNRLRRIYTDGRRHPADPDLTFHGHSIGHWEGDTLVVDTVGILPQTFLAVSESVGVPNNGDVHIVERIRLTGPDTLQFEMTITAPKVLTAPWKTTRTWFRQRKQKYDIVEGVCLQGFFADRVDKNGFAIFEPIPHDNGNPVPLTGPSGGPAPK